MVGLSANNSLNPSSQLSGGQIQRVKLARCLYNDANYYIFDEPTAALDPNLSQQILQKLKIFLSSKTVIIITHDPSIASLCTNHLHIRSTISGSL